MSRPPASRFVPLAIPRLLVGALLVPVTACVSEDEPAPLTYVGAIQVTERVFGQSGTSTGSISGLITIPSALAPTATASGCDYHGGRPRAGVTLGRLAVNGLVEPVVFEPTSYIDGMLYHYALPPDAVAEGAVVTAVLEGMSVSVQAVAPAALASVVLPETISFVDSATVAWEAGGADEIVIQVQDEGLGTFRMLVCRAADTGSFTFPVEALALFDGQPADALILLTRRNRGLTSSESADLELQLAVESEVFAGVTLTP